MSDTKTYVGCKVVKAYPQDRTRADSGIEAGYAVLYPDGYNSWSPKDVFDKAYIQLAEHAHEAPEYIELLADIALEQAHLDRIKKKLDANNLHAEDAEWYSEQYGYASRKLDFMMARKLRMDDPKDPTSFLNPEYTTTRMKDAVERAREHGLYHFFSAPVGSGKTESISKLVVEGDVVVVEDLNAMTEMVEMIGKRTDIDPSKVSIYINGPKMPRSAYYSPTIWFDGGYTPEKAQAAHMNIHRAAMATMNLSKKPAFMFIR